MPISHINILAALSVAMIAILQKMVSGFIKSHYIFFGILLKMKFWRQLPAEYKIRDIGIMLKRKFLKGAN
jgi:hypothetical protein